MSEANRVEVLEAALRQIISYALQPHQQACCVTIAGQIAVSAYHNNMVSESDPMRVCIHCAPINPAGSKAMKILAAFKTHEDRDIHDD